MRVLPIGDDYHNPISLTLMDSKKHWNHDFRRGVVEAMDPVISWHVPDVMLGDVIIFSGSAGFTMDGDIMDEEDKYDAPLKGEGWRWLRWHEVQAIDDGTTQKLLEASHG